MQVLGVYLVEGLTIGIPIALAAPFLAAAPVALLGLSPVFSNVSGSGLLPAGVPPVAFVWAAFAVLVSITTILLPAAIVARRGALAHRRVLIHEEGVVDPQAGATVRLSRPDLLMTLFAGVPAADRIGSGDIIVDGDPALYEALVDLFEPVDPNFNIVTP